MSSSGGLRNQYAIRVGVHLDSRWAARFDGMTLAVQSDGTTVLSGIIPDQAALYGVLQKLRDAGAPLVSVVPLDGGARSADRSHRA
ncbi:hypothetical protein [Microbacterium flavescens]|uniref:hypothetical protein n=1 Tax=Microbacterium flavescens TaxID=69366 RepID=UPI001BDDDD06|nr:hypothetical protein [Microbacterium flavescens]BFF10081.1 hypothetical protein GCM10025699_13840 [Microbacterium flavescens]